MADNISVVAGQSSGVSGTVTVASKDIGGVEYQRVIVSKPDGSGDLGDASNPLPIKLQTPTAAGLQRAKIDGNANGDNILVAGVGGQTIRVFKLFVVFGGGVNAKFKESTPADLTGAMSMVQNGSIFLGFDGEPWFVAPAGKDFILNLSAGVQISGAVYYTQS